MSAQLGPTSKLCRVFAACFASLTLAAVSMLLVVGVPGARADSPLEAVLWVEDFDDGIPPAWTVLENAAGGVIWTDVAGSDEGDNYTGGAGDAATASSDYVGETSFDTELRTPLFDLPDGISATLTYRANYQNMLHHDSLDLDVSTDGGATWDTLLHWSEDHPPEEIGFRKASGESVAVDLSAYLGVDGLMLRWRYYDPRENAWDWYAQIDDVRVVVQGADLQIDKRGPAASVAPGQPVTYALTYANAGPALATDVVITDEIPGLLNDVWFSGGGVAITATDGVSYTWRVADLPVGAGGVITVGGVLTTGLPAGTTFTNTALITGTADFDLGDNRASVAVAVANAPPMAAADVITTAEDTPATVDVLANDGDLNADSLSIVAVETAAGSAASIAGPTIVYTPALDFYGSG